MNNQEIKIEKLQQQKKKLNRKGKEKRDPHP